MGDPRKTYGNMARMGIRGREDLRGMGCSVWLTRCWVADFAVFCELPESSVDGADDEFSYYAWEVVLYGPLGLGRF